MSDTLGVHSPRLRPNPGGLTIGFSQVGSSGIRSNPRSSRLESMSLRNTRLASNQTILEIRLHGPVSCVALSAAAVIWCRLQ